MPGDNTRWEATVGITAFKVLSGPELMPIPVLQEAEAVITEADRNILPEEVAVLPLSAGTTVVMLSMSTETIRDKVCISAG